jgi:cobalamin biosynthesis Mg chelatase CobN
MDNGSNKQSPKRESELIEEEQSTTKVVARENDSALEQEKTDVFEKVEQLRSFEAQEDELFSLDDERVQQEDTLSVEEDLVQEEELSTSDTEDAQEGESPTSAETSAQKDVPHTTNDEHSNQEQPVEENEDMPSSDAGESITPAGMRADQKETAQNEEKKTRAPRKKKRTPKPRLRLIPIWLRILIAIVLIGGCFILGLMFGFGVIGNQEPAEVIKPETWYHIIDFIRGDN